MSDEHLERAFLSNEDPCFISSQRDLHRALNEEQQLLAVDTLEELLHNQKLTEKNHQELLELVKTDRYSEAQKLLNEAGSQGNFHIEKSVLFTILKWSKEEVLIDKRTDFFALETIDEMLVKNESDVVCWNGRGYLLDELGNYEEAISSIEN